VSVKSKRLRFEILKRDGFRCRYCGASAASAVLHVDHVVAESAGGEDVPENLVTACAACNGGKSNVGLDESRLSTTTVEDIQQNTQDIKAYLDACRAQKQARDGLHALATEYYWENIGPLVGDRISPSLDGALLKIMEEDGLPMLIQGMEATYRKVSAQRMSATDAARYFFGVMKRLRAAKQGPQRGPYLIKGAVDWLAWRIYEHERPDDVDHTEITRVIGMLDGDGKEVLTALWNFAMLHEPEEVA